MKNKAVWGKQLINCVSSVNWMFHRDTCRVHCVNITYLLWLYCSLFNVIRAGAFNAFCLLKNIFPHPTQTFSSAWHIPGATEVFGLPNETSDLNPDSTRSWIHFYRQTSTSDQVYPNTRSHTHLYTYHGARHISIRLINSSGTYIQAYFSWACKFDVAYDKSVNKHFNSKCLLSS